MVSQSQRMSAIVRKRIAAGTWWNPFRNKLWEPHEIALLGTMTDKEVSQRIGRSVDAVAGRRINSGIPAFVGQKTWTDEEDDLLGTMSDHAVAIQLGRSMHSVRQRRYRLGIETYKPYY